MSATRTWGGLNDVELGLVIGACGLAIILGILFITLCVHYCCKKDKKSKPDKEEQREGMVNMQTSRTVDGQNMQQVLIKNPPNGNLDRENQNDIPYKVMDPETNTVRYDTAGRYTSGDEVTLTFHDNEGRDTKVITKTENEDIDSGTGASPTRTSADIHNAHDNAAFVEEVETQQTVDITTEDDHADVAPYGYYMPPPPTTDPPPLTPGTPVTDLDADDDELPPPPAMAPPPPKVEDYTYAEVNKTRRTEEPASTSNTGGNSMSDVWRPRDAQEIQIIEKSTF